MTNERLLILAYEAALNNWGEQKRKLDANPNDPIRQYLEGIAWKELREIKEMFKKENEQ